MTPMRTMFLDISKSFDKVRHEVKINCYDALQISVLSLGVFILLRLSLVNYVTLNTDLNLYGKKKTLLISTQCILMYLSLTMLGLLLLSESEKEQIVLLIIRANPIIGNVVDVSLKFNKVISRFISATLSLYIVSISITSATCTLCLIIFQIWCHSYVKRVPHWLPIILIILSNYIHLNPSPSPPPQKSEKQLIKNYRPISLLPVCGKILENIIFNNLYSYLHTNNLITKNNSGFHPGDSTTNQLLYLLDEIHQIFHSTKSLEVRTVFLDISKAFDKVWHDGLIFKLEQNGILGNLLKLLKII